MIHTPADRELKDAAYNGDLDRVVSALSAGGDPDKANPAGQTALNYAVKRRHLDCVRAMLKAGANPNPTGNPMQSRPLFLAELNEDEAMYDLLLEFGALEDAPDLGTDFTRISPESEKEPIANSSIDRWTDFVSRNSLDAKRIRIPRESDRSENGAYFEILNDVERQIEANEASPGVEASTNGFFPIGGCLEMSGDPYFLRHADSFDTKLYRIYHDAYDPANQDGVEVVLEDYAQITDHVEQGGGGQAATRSEST
jgi:ankyrin repeat protein